MFFFHLVAKLPLGVSKRPLQTAEEEEEEPSESATPAKKRAVSKSSGSGKSSGMR